MPFLLLMPLLFVMSACATKVTYDQPIEADIVNAIVVDDDFEDVWDKLVPRLSKSFFVINNIAKDSKILNVSYSGDPEKYVDCGTLKIQSPTAGPKEMKTYPASRARINEQVVLGIQTFTMSRSLDLDGRINVVLEEMDDGTQVSVNSRYVLNRSVRYEDIYGHLVDSDSESIIFNTNQKGVSNSGQYCVATGVLEAEILSLVK